MNVSTPLSFVNYTSASFETAGSSSAASRAALSPSHLPTLSRSNIDDRSLAALDALQQRHELAYWANEALQNPDPPKITPDRAEVAPAQDKPVQYSWVIPSQEGKSTLHFQVRQISDQPGRYELLALGRLMNGNALDCLPIKCQPASSSNDRPGQKPSAGSGTTRSHLVDERSWLTPYQPPDDNGISSQERFNRTGKSAYTVLKQQQHIDLLLNMREALEEAVTRSQKPMADGSKVYYVDVTRKFLGYLENERSLFLDFINKEGDNAHPALRIKINEAVEDGEASYDVIPALNKAFGYELYREGKNPGKLQKESHIDLVGKMKVLLENSQDITQKIREIYLSSTRGLLSYLEDIDQPLPENWSAGEKRSEIERVVNDAIEKGKVHPGVRAALNKTFGFGLLSLEDRKWVPRLLVHQELLKIVESILDLPKYYLPKIRRFFVSLEQKGTSWPVFRMPSLVEAGSGLKQSISDDKLLTALKKVLPATDSCVIEYMSNRQPHLISKNISDKSIDKLYLYALDLSLSEETKLSMDLVNSLSNESNPLAWAGKQEGMDQFETIDSQGEFIFVRTTQNRSSQYDINQIGFRYANGIERSWSLD